MNLVEFRGVKIPKKEIDVLRAIEHTIKYPREFHLGAISATMGGHIRVGMEEYIFIDYDPEKKERKLAKSNAELVEKMVRIVNDLGREVTTPDEVRKMLSHLLKLLFGKQKKVHKKG